MCLHGWPRPQQFAAAAAPQGKGGSCRPRHHSFHPSIYPSVAIKRACEPPFMYPAHHISRPFMRATHLMLQLSPGNAGNIPRMNLHTPCCSAYLFSDIHAQLLI